jgi:hypothetical protein
MSRFATSSPAAAAGDAPPDAAARLLEQHLFFDPDVKAYAVLDGASAPGLLGHLQKHRPPYHCLYRGELPPDIAEVAPYLVELHADNPLTKVILSEGWGNHWGVFVQTAADLRAMRKHFRTFLMVNDADGKPLYFRYYDPRVLRTFLPTCNTREASIIFGPVRSYLMEAADKSIVRFRLHDTSHLPIAEPVNRPPEFVAETIGGSGGNGRRGQS